MICEIEMMNSHAGCLYTAKALTKCRLLKFGAVMFREQVRQRTPGMQHATYTWHAACNVHLACSMQRTPDAQHPAAQVSHCSVWATGDVAAL
jgi:hypothetical protein